MKVLRHVSVGASLLFSAALVFSQSGIGPITTSVPNARLRVGAPATLIAPGSI